MRTHTVVCTKVEGRGLPHSVSTLFFEIVSLTEPGAHGFSKLLWQLASGSSVSASPVLAGVTAPVTTPSFDVGSELAHQVFY